MSWQREIDQMQELLEQIESTRREHLVVDDCWYSCPLSSEGCCDEQARGCTCGVGVHNTKVDAAKAMLIVHIDWLGEKWAAEIL